MSETSMPGRFSLQTTPRQRYRGPQLVRSDLARLDARKRNFSRKNPFTSEFVRQNTLALCSRWSRAEKECVVPAHVRQSRPDDRPANPKITKLSLTEVQSAFTPLSDQYPP